MAFLKLTSDNPRFGYVISKNPETGIKMVENRFGAMFGYYPKAAGVVNTQAYCILFQDASDSISYKKHPDETFEYLNASKYNNARFVDDAISTLFRLDKVETDAPSNMEMFVNLVATQFKTIDIFRRHFTSITIESEEVSLDNYRLTFKTNEPMTLGRFLNIIDIFSIFATLNSEDYTYLPDERVDKYIRICQEIDAPYFIRYLIKVRMLRVDHKFERVKAKLEASDTHKIEMLFGDTHEMRMRFVKAQVDHSLPIVDIGAGEDFRYLKMYSKGFDNGSRYYAIERDFDARERIKAAIRGRGWTGNAEVFETLEDFLFYYKTIMNGEKVNVICSEVLEHNTFNEARTIVSEICDRVDFDKFVVTLPNAEFNSHYGLTGMRHDDHKWEATKRKVDTLFSYPLITTNFEVIEMPVGDKVDGIEVTKGIIVKKNAQS